MTLLTIIQDACGEIGLSQPNAVTTNVDPQIVQMLSLINREGKTLAARWEWQRLRKEASFTTVAAENQGALSTIAPGLKYVIQDTVWNRDLKRPIFGEVSPQRWQQLKALTLQGPWNQFVIRENQIKFLPSPAAGQSCYFEYISTYWALAADGVTAKAKFDADDDTAVLDEDILTVGLIWRWKQAKGFEYAEDFASYERLVTDAIARDGSKDVINMGDVKWDIFPGIVVPSGSWPL